MDLFRFRRSHRLAVFALFVVACLASGVARAEEWPKWLGPNGTGIATDPIASQWPADGPKKLWTQNVGLGFSSIVGQDGVVYAFGMKANNDVLTAIEADTGKVRWSESYVVTHRADQPQAKNDENGLPLPEASPTIDGDRIYTYGGGSDLVCRKLTGGTVVWQLNVLDATGASILQWNAASSPLISNGFVYVQGGQGGALAVAVDQKSGKIAWKSGNGLGGYAAPIIVEAGGTQQLIIFGGDALHGLDPLTGKSLWSYPWKTQYDVNASTPVYQGGHLFITSGNGHGCAMLELNAKGVKVEWKGKEISSLFQPTLLDNGLLFGNSNGRFKCLKWPTNDVLWSSNAVKLGTGGSIVIDGDQAIALSEKGTLSLVRIGAAEPTVTSEVALFDGEKIWSSPVIYHSKLYVKGKEDLVCLNIGK